MANYILKTNINPETMENWTVEPCSPFEILGVVQSGDVNILFFKTSDALGEFFTGMGWNPDSFLNYTCEIPDEFSPDDVTYFVFCPRPGTFQFWKGQKSDEI